LDVVSNGITFTTIGPQKTGVSGRGRTQESPIVPNHAEELGSERGVEVAREIMMET
jgi:hypothetical protein